MLDDTVEASPDDAVLRLLCCELCADCGCELTPVSACIAGISLDTADDSQLLVIVRALLAVAVAVDVEVLDVQGREVTVRTSGEVATGSKTRQSDIWNAVRAVHRASPADRVSIASAERSVPLIRRSCRPGREVRNNDKIVLRALCTCMLLKCTFCTAQPLSLCAQLFKYVILLLMVVVCSTSVRRKDVRQDSTLAKMKRNTSPIRKGNMPRNF